MSGHNHGGKMHLLGMLGVGVGVLVVLLVAGRSIGEAVPLAAALACPLMMIGMMFMMMRSGKGNRGNDDAVARTGQAMGSEPIAPPHDVAQTPASRA